MGNQLTKTRQQQRSSNYRSLRSSPVHRTQTSTTTSSLSTSSQPTRSSQNQTFIPNNIVIVNRGPNHENDSDVGVKTRLELLSEPLIKPLIPYGQSIVINSDHPRLSVRPIIEIGCLFEQNLRFAAETVSGEQQKICDKIRLVEQQSNKLIQSFCQEKQRRFSKAVENFGKFNDIQILLDRCETDIEQLLTTFAKLNSALPESLCLENFQSPWDSDHIASTTKIVQSSSIRNP